MYIVIRRYYRYGQEGDYVDCTFKEFGTFEKAQKYGKRYATGIKFVSYQIEDETGNIMEEYYAGE